MSPQAARPLAVAIALALWAGCATTPQPPSPQAPAAPPASAAGALLVGPPEPSESHQVRFDSDPEGAELLIDNRLRGLTPLLLDTLPAGRYKVEARRTGYRPLTVWITHAGAAARYTLALVPYTGRLTVTVVPADARITVAGGVYPPGTYDLPAGAQTVRASAWGYLDAEQTVLIEPGAATTAHFVLVTAPLAAHLLSAWPRTLDPRAALGGARVTYEITAPASGRMRVRAAGGTEVYSAPLPEIKGPRQTAVWNGRAADGATLPDGVYLLDLAFTSMQGEEATLEVALRIAAGNAPRALNLWSGLSGLQYAPAPQVAQPGSGSLSLTTGVSFVPAGDAQAVSAPVSLAASRGFAGGWELDVASAALLVASPPLPFLVSAGVKRNLPTGNTGLAAAATARLALQAGSGTDPFTAFTALALGAPVAARLGPLLLTLAPEIALSPWRVTGDSTYDDNPSLNAWAYLRGGLATEIGPVALGLSAAARTAPFAEGLSVAQPVAVALEARTALPASRLMLSLWGATEIGSATVEQVLAGTSFHYLY